MQTLSAVLLLIALLLSGTASKDVDPDAAVKTGSYFIRVLEAAMRVEADAPTPATVKNIATVAEPANLYSSYSQSTRVLARLKKGDELSIKRRAVYSSTEWVYVTAKDYNVSGWVLQSQLNMPGIVEDADLDAGEISEDYVPAYAKMGIVSTDQLNIRTAPGTGFDRIGAYRSGDRVGIIETNNGWGRTAKGWIYLGYVYLDGQVGSNPMVGNVTADRL
ncbi:MAG: SH3 domain-containing protein, partial [Faecousia sp.]